MVGLKISKQVCCSMDCTIDHSPSLSMYSRDPPTYYRPHTGPNEGRVDRPPRTTGSVCPVLVLIKRGRQGFNMDPMVNVGIV